MFAIFLFLFAGIGIGVGLRRFPNITIIGKLMTGVIFVLLFLLGKSVGKNDAIMNNLASIGMQAFIITSAAIAGSVLMSWIVYKYFFEEKKTPIEDIASADVLVNKPVL